MNEQDLAAFNALITSPIRSEERENALQTWSTYKQERQLSQISADKKLRGESDVLGKHDYIRSLTEKVVNISGATLTDVCVGYADLRGMIMEDVTVVCDLLPWCALKGANLENASLQRATLKELRLIDADLRNTDLSAADLSGADLTNANLQGAILRNTNFKGAILERTNLVGCDIEGAIFDDACVYGISAWDVKGEPLSSKNLVVTPNGQAQITTDNIKIAQFLYLLTHNPDIRDALDTVTQKVVLLLGRFSPERKAILDSLRDSLRDMDLVPVMFDFARVDNQDFTETITLLARLSRFIIADITEPASIPQELQAIAPNVAVPISLIIQQGHEPYSMSKNLKKYHWVLRPQRYTDTAHLLTEVKPKVVNLAEHKLKELRELKRQDDW